MMQFSEHGAVTSMAKSSAVSVSPATTGSRLSCRLVSKILQSMRDSKNPDCIRQKPLKRSVQIWCSARGSPSLVNGARALAFQRFSSTRSSGFSHFRLENGIPRPLGVRGFKSHPPHFIIACSIRHFAAKFAHLLITG